jgi:hypothetical protein
MLLILASRYASAVRAGLSRPMQANAKCNPKLPAQLTLDTVSPATRLLEKRRQMFEVQEALDAQKEEFER